MSISRDIYIVRIACIFYTIASVSLVLILSIFTNYFLDMYDKSLTTSLIGPINVVLQSYSLPRENWCIYTIYYITQGREYINLYEDSCKFINYKETNGFYKPNNPYIIFLDRNQLDCQEIPKCEYYYNMSKTLRISNISTSIINLLIITIISLNIYRLEGLQQLEHRIYLNNSIINPIQIIINH